MNDTVKFSDLAGGTPAAPDIFPFVPSGGASAKKVTFTALASAILGLNAGTVTADAPVLNLAQTWNNAGVAFSGLKFSVTDSASAAGSLLMNLVNSNGSYSRFDKLGCLTTYDGTGINPDAKTLMTLGAAGYTVFKIGTGTGLNVGFDCGGSFAFQATGSGRINGVNGTMAFALPKDGRLGWLVANARSETVDLCLLRDAANTLAQRNGTNAQTFNLYGTFTDSSNYERLSIDLGVFAAGYAFIRPVSAGTGGNNHLALAAGGGNTAGAVTMFSATTGTILQFGTLNTNFWGISAAGHLIDQGTHNLTIGGGLRVIAPSVPASAGSAGNAGDIAWDSGFIYVCTATSTWKRTAIATW